MSCKTAWAEIDTGAIRHNVSMVKQKLKAGTRICAVLKGDAYGHGLAAMARFLGSEGLADMIAVGRPDELVRLAEAERAVACREGRKADQTPVLLIGAVEADEVEALLLSGQIDPGRVIFSVFSMRQYQELRRLAQRRGIRISLHVRVDEWDSGMGIGYDTFLRHEKMFFSSEYAEVCGLYAHLYSSYFHDFEKTKKDLEDFDAFVRQIAPQYRDRLTIHVMNSALLFDFPEYSYDMVRAGAAIYGLPCGDKGVLREAMRICARVFCVKDVSGSVPLSYHPGSVLPGKRRIARMMIGYGDCPLLLTQKDVSVEIRGKSFRLADDVCMDNLCVDVSGCDEITPGDIAVLLGKGNVTPEKIMKRNEMAYVHSDWLCMTTERLEKRFV